MRILKSLTENLIDSQIISEDEGDIVLYGLERMIGGLSGLLITLGIGFCCGSEIMGLFLWLFVYPLRCYAGGYHADTRVKCMVISAAMLAAVFAGIIFPGWPPVVHRTVFVVCFFVIWILAPVGTPSKPLDEQEHAVYRNRTRRVLVTEGMAAMAAQIGNWPNIYFAVEMAFVVVAISLAAGRWKLSGF